MYVTEADKGIRLICMTDRTPCSMTIYFGMIYCELYDAARSMIHMNLETSAIAFSIRVLICLI